MSTGEQNSASCAFNESSELIEFVWQKGLLADFGFSFDCCF